MDIYIVYKDAGQIVTTKFNTDKKEYEDISIQVNYYFGDFAYWFYDLDDAIDYEMDLYLEMLEGGC